MPQTLPISSSRSLRALIVYSRVGGGHLSAARALAAELEASGQASARLTDAYLEHGRFPITRFPRIYGRLASRHPRLWSFIYRATSHDLNPSLVVGPFLRPGFQRLIREDPPDLIVSVLPAINEILSEAPARLEVVLTDWHAVHRFWIANGVDHYTAPTDSARDDCIRFGAPPEAVDVVGIPVRRQFSDATSLRQVPHERFTILAMVGAEGSPRSLANLVAVAQSGIDAQMTVVCGRNQRLRERIERLPSRMPLRAVGFVEDVASLMRSADLLLTKAGGLTLAEAFCCGLPVVVHDVVPGQEAGNLDYVLRHGAVAHAGSPVALVATIASLVADANRREELAECGKRLARPEAAQQIAANLLARV